MTTIAQSSVHVQLSPDSCPSMPPWFGEIAILAQVLTQRGVLSLIEERVRFARARFGVYEVVDFLAVLFGYAVSGEPTLRAFYHRLLPFASAFQALFGRQRLPDRSTLSRFLAALDAPAVEALRTLFQEELGARAPFVPQPGGLWDRSGQYQVVIDVDATRQAARQRSLPRTSAEPAAKRRLGQVCAPGYTGRRRGEVVRTRTTVLQAHTQQWLGTFAGAGNGDYRGELLRACETIHTYARQQGLRPSQILVRLDGLYGMSAPLLDLLARELGFVVRGSDYDLLALPIVQQRLAGPADQERRDPETGVCRQLFDCLEVPLGFHGPPIRLVVATHPQSREHARVGRTQQGTTSELFLTTLPPQRFTASDVLDLYLHRGAFECVLADEDREQDPDRWCSHAHWGQECWQILSQWVWNLRLEWGAHLCSPDMRLTDFAPAQPLSVEQETPPLPVEQEMPPVPVEQEAPPAPQIPGLQGYGPLQWAAPTRRTGFAGADFSPQPDGTLRCPAGHPLYPGDRRPGRDGSVRLLFIARIAHCRPCPLRERCQGSGASTHPRHVSAVCWPTAERVPLPSPPSRALRPLPAAGPHPLRWGDWPRCHFRRRWLALIRSQTVVVEPTGQGSCGNQAPATASPAPLTRAKRAHRRLDWAQRATRNARCPSFPRLSITVSGLPVSFAHAFGFATTEEHAR